MVSLGHAARQPVKPAALIAAACLLLTGCQSLPPALRGGSATSTLSGLPPPISSPQTGATLHQPDNPAATSAQTVERQESRQEVAPQPVTRTTVREYPPTPENPGGLRVTITDQFGPPTVLTHTLSEKTGTSIGAAQKDTARELAAKLGSFKAIQAAGIGFFVFALACFHPVVRRISGGGKTLPALAAVAGIICIFGPALFVGRETLALVLIAAGLLVAFLVVRLSHKEGQADALRSSPPAGG